MEVYIIRKHEHYFAANISTSSFVGEAFLDKETATNALINAIYNENYSWTGKTLEECKDEITKDIIKNLWSFEDARHIISFALEAVEVYFASSFAPQRA